MDMTQLEQQNQLLQQQLDVFAEAIRQQKLAMEEADARVAELTDIVNHLSEKLRDRDELIKDQEAQLNALRSQLLTNGAPAGAKEMPPNTMVWGHSIWTPQHIEKPCSKSFHVKQNGRFLTFSRLFRCAKLESSFLYIR